MLKLRSAVQLVCLLAIAASARLNAQQCSAYLFPGDLTQVKQAIVSTPKAWFYASDPQQCPTEGDHCRKSAYVLHGNVVLTGQQSGPFVCAAFIRGRRQTTGWLQAAALHPAPWTSTAGSWAGTWVRLDSNSTLEIRTRNGGLYADALATYAVTAENVRTGEARGPLKIAGAGTDAIATFLNDGDPQCHVTLRQSGTRLLVDDGVLEDANSSCGGIGVTLSGVYRKAHAR